MNLLEALKSLGFTQQEATIYIKLAGTDSMTGSRPPNQAGYRGATRTRPFQTLWTKATPTPSRAIPSIMLPSARKTSLPTPRGILKDSRHDRRQALDHSCQQGSVYHHHGEDAILNKLKNVILQADQRIYVSVGNDILEQLEEELIIACEKGAQGRRPLIRGHLLR